MTTKEKAGNLTQLQDRFCLQYAMTGRGKDSAIAAGFKPSNSENTACILLQKPHIQARIQEIKKPIEEAIAKKIADNSIMSIIERKARLSEIARGKLTDFVKLDGDSLAIDLEAANAGALQEVSIESWRGGKEERAESRTSKVKLRNPIEAIQELNKMDGSYPLSLHAFVGEVRVRVIYDEDKPKEPSEPGQEEE